MISPKVQKMYSQRGKTENDEKNKSKTKPMYTAERSSHMHVPNYYLKSSPNHESFLTDFVNHYITF